MNLPPLDVIGHDQTAVRFGAAERGDGAGGDHAISIRASLRSRV